MCLRFCRRYNYIVCLSELQSLHFNTGLLILYKLVCKVSENMEVKIVYKHAKKTTVYITIL